MALSDQLKRLKDNLTESYAVCSDKGSTIPELKNFDNLPDCINSLPSVVNNIRVTIEPATTGQSLTPPEGYTGFSNVTVNPVTASIDNDIVSENILEGVSILGIDGSIVLDEVTIEPSTTGETLVHGGVGGYSTIVVEPVTSSIDADISAANIKSGISILGIEGTVVQSKTHSISINTNGTYAPAVGYTGFDNVVVNNPVVVDNENLTIQSSFTSQTFTPTQNKTGFGTVIVEPTTGIPREISSENVLQMPSGSYSYGLPNNVIDLGDYVLMDAFYRSSIISADFSNLTDVSGSQAMYEAFYGCSNLSSVDFTNLESVSGITALGYAFHFCTSSSFVSVSFPSLTSIGISSMAHAFDQCVYLTTVDLGNLTTVGTTGLSSTFMNCTNLSSVDFSNLSVLAGSALSSTFSGCTSLSSLSFPSLNSNSFGESTNQFNQMLYNVTGCTVHFPSNLQSVIGSWSDVTAGFGGTNTIILFDLPATT